MSLIGPDLQVETCLNDIEHWGNNIVWAFYMMKDSNFILTKKQLAHATYEQICLADVKLEYEYC